MYRLKLYISNHSEKTEKVIDSLKKVLLSLCGDSYSLEIINIVEKPELCLKDDIFATPTLVKFEPQPVKKVIGDIYIEQKIISALKLM
jgi:circadian clock protein KaiB